MFGYRSGMPVLDTMAVGSTESGEFFCLFMYEIGLHWAKVLCSV